jgi:phage I-like protein/cation transport regulator ChaB
MPYTIDKPPDRIKSLPKHAQKIWIAAYNSAWNRYNGDEGKSNGTAWAAVKKKYKKNKEGKWVKMGEPRLIFDVPLAFKEMPDGKYKSTIPVAKTGKWKHPEYGEFAITDKDLSEIEANFGTVREALPPVNYEHNEGVDASVGAAGWVQKVWRDDGKLLGEVYWTKEGWNKVEEGAFKYISPEIRFNYKDKENGESKGTVLVGAALTTKPWIEDLAIVLSENVFTTDNPIDKLGKLLDLRDYDRRSILDALEKFLDNQFDIDLPDFANKINVIRTLISAISEFSYLSEIPSGLFKEAAGVIVELREWTRKYINDLPDSAFAYIEPGGEKDEEGKTKPRALRHFPYKDKDGKVDLPHLRNALARAPQSPFGKKALPKLKAAAKKAGVGETKKGGEIDVDIKTLIEKLKLNEDATEEVVIATIDELISKASIDLTELRKELSLGDAASIDEVLEKLKELKSSIKADDETGSGEDEKKELSEQVATLSSTVESLTARLTETEQKAQEYETKLKEKERDERINKALREGKLSKAMVDSWANELALSEPDRFDKVISTMPVIVDLSEIGYAGEGEIDAIARFNDEILRIQKEKEVSYGDAMNILANEKPELALEYQQAARG